MVTNRSGCHHRARRMVRILQNIGWERVIVSWNVSALLLFALHRSRPRRLRFSVSVMQRLPSPPTYMAKASRSGMAHLPAGNVGAPQGRDVLPLPTSNAVLVAGLITKAKKSMASAKTPNYGKEIGAEPYSATNPFCLSSVSGAQHQTRSESVTNFAAQSVTLSTQLLPPLLHVLFDPMKFQYSRCGLLTLTKAHNLLKTCEDSLPCVALPSETNLAPATHFSLSNSRSFFDAC
jgi:hypothetical protein